MITLVHCADLHLTSGDERTYSLSVLDEIIEIVIRAECAYFLICGDLFDRSQDSADLSAEVFEALGRLEGRAEVLCIPGNHDPVIRDDQDGGIGSLEHVHVMQQRPYTLFQHGDVEFLCIPHTADYSGYHEWQIPPKEGDYRVALAHGLVTGMDIYVGPGDDEDVDGGAIDSDLFERFDVDYAALGHIHRGNTQRINGTILSYPGSARVWRRGESGPRGYNLVSLGDVVEAEFKSIGPSGEYRRYDLPIEPDGSVPGVEALAKTWQAQDWVALCLTGFVDSDALREESATQLRRQVGRHVRRLDVNTDDVASVSGVAGHPLVRSFLDAMETSKPAANSGRDLEVWLRSRALGLEQIRQAMGT